MDTIRLAADPTCSANIQTTVEVVDRVLAMGNPTLTRLLKGVFGLADLTSDADFASVISVCDTILGILGGVLTIYVLRALSAIGRAATGTPRSITEGSSLSASATRSRVMELP
jgi:hypothetical protein